MKRRAFSEDLIEIETSYAVKRYGLRSMLKELSDYFTITACASLEISKHVGSLDMVEISLKRLCEVLCVCITASADTTRMTYSSNRKRAIITLNATIPEEKRNDLMLSTERCGFEIEISDNFVTISMDVKTGISVAFYAKTQRIIYNTLKYEFSQIKKARVLP